MMGMMFPVFAIPVLSLALVAWAVASRRLSERTSARVDGRRHPARVRSVHAPADRRHHRRRRFGFPLAVDGDSRGTAPGPGGDEPTALPAPAAAETPEKPLVPEAGDEAGDAAAAVPQERTRAPTGPAFADPSATASFAACGSRPTGPSRRRSSCGAGRSDRAGRPSRSAATSSTPRSSAVTTRSSSCYNVTTGEPVWRHRDAARFWESNAGAGPRGTPTLSNGRVYTFGATGIVNALDAGDGAVVWSRNAASDTGTKIPDWGFASSPLVVDDVVIVAAAGQLAAYDVATGDPRWFGPAGGVELQLATSGDDRRSRADPAAERSRRDQRRAGRRHAALGARVAAGDGIVQPALTADGDVLIGSGADAMGGIGMRRIAVAHGPGGWTVEERWTSTRAEALLQRLRRSRGPCLRLRRQHPRVHRSRGRQAQVEGRTLRPRPARPVARPGPAAGAVGGG